MAAIYPLDADVVGLEFVHHSECHLSSTSSDIAAWRLHTNLGS